MAAARCISACESGAAREAGGGAGGTTEASAEDISVSALRFLE